MNILNKIKPIQNLVAKKKINWKKVILPENFQNLTV